jgi:hypothetical protein
MKCTGGSGGKEIERCWGVEMGERHERPKRCVTDLGSESDLEKNVEVLDLGPRS